MAEHMPSLLDYPDWEFIALLREGKGLPCGIEARYDGHTRAVMWRDSFDEAIAQVLTYVQICVDREAANGRPD